MVGIRVCIVLERVGVCSKPIVADILQIVFSQFPVGEVQSSSFQAVNLLVNGEWFLGVSHSLWVLVIKIEDPPGALNQWEARKVILSAKIHIKTRQTTINDTFLSFFAIRFHFLR